MKPNNRNINKALELARELMFCADKGDMQRDDEGCGVLYGIIRDCAYKIRSAARREKENHRDRGVWDIPEEE